MEHSLSCRRVFSPLAGALLIGWLAAAGCSKGEMQSVTGKITLPDGKPAAGVVITFDSPTLHLSASGQANDAGEYSLSTNVPGDGAKVGSYQVAVRQLGPADSSQGEPPRQFPKRYEDAATSGLTFDVKAGQTNRYDITLESQ